MLDVPKTARAKALLATAFAVSALTLPLSAIADDSNMLKKSSATEQILTDTTATSLTRAFVLLKLADSYQRIEDQKSAERNILGDGRKFPTFEWGRILLGRHSPLQDWCNQLAVEQSRMTLNDSQKKRNSTLADDALKKSLAQIELIPEPDQKLKLYYIASMLFKKAGQDRQYNECQVVLARAFSSCESAKIINENRIKGSISVLNSMAYGVLPVVIPELLPLASSGGRQRFSWPVDSQKLKIAEALRSRALAMADRLDAESDVRRRAHRDMAIWYLQLGKNESAVREKQALFGLVGFKDDTLLYPQSGPCGLLSWWERPGSGRTNFDCGMG